MFNNYLPLNTAQSLVCVPLALYGSLLTGLCGCEVWAYSRPVVQGQQCGHPSVPNTMVNNRKTEALLSLKNFSGAFLLVFIRFVISLDMLISNTSNLL